MSTTDMATNTTAAVSTTQMDFAQNSTTDSSIIINTTLDFLANVTALIDDEINSTTNGTLTVYERNWMYYAFGPVICGFGIFCNILNMCVLLQRELREAPYTYLTVLATTDLLFLSLAFTHLVLSKATPTIPKAFLDAYLFFAFGNACFNCSVWITVVMTMDRVLFVTNPMKFRPSRKSARIRVLIIFIVCCIINIPRLFCYTIIEYRGYHYPYGTPFRETRLFFKLSWFHAVIINFIPLIVLITANTILIVTLRRAGQQRESLRMNREESVRRDQVRLTRTLIAIVILFFICTTPSAFAEDPIAYTLFGGDKNWSEYLKSPANQTFIYISNLLLFLNSSLNFVLYCAFNQKFRQAMYSFFVKLNLRKTRRRVDTQRSTMSTTTTSESRMIFPLKTP